IPVMGLNTCDPLKLFADGEDGAILDAFPLSVVFQDDTGTTPGAAGSPLGLELDKHLGGELGPGLVTNGDFDADTNWSKGESWTISDGKASRSTASTFSNISQSLSLPSDTSWFLLEIDIDSISGSGFVGVLLGTGGAFAYFNTPGKHVR